MDWFGPFLFDSEAEWEKEIRRDEKRINRYFYELPICIDLPEEESCIYSDISSIPELVPRQMSMEEWKRLPFRDEEFDAEFDERMSELFREDEFVKMLDALSVEWNIFCVERLSLDTRCNGIGVTCAISKLIARICDFNNAGKNHNFPLQKSLGKFVMQDIDSLVLSIMDIVNKQPDVSIELDAFIQTAEHIRAALERKIKSF